MHDHSDKKIHLSINILSRLSNFVELSYEWEMKYFNNQEPVSYEILYDDYEEVTFEVLPGHTKVGVIIKLVRSATKLYIFHGSNIADVLCSLDGVNSP